MIYYKISFLIVLISVVCFSADVNVDPALQREDNITNCKYQMYMTFEGTESQKLCVHHAIKDMKLYGDSKDHLDDHVYRYYTSFHSHVKLDSVTLPEKFCNRRQNKNKIPDCTEKIKIFTEIPPNPSGSSSSGSSDDTMITNEDDEFTIILKNALYYHVTFDPKRRPMPGNEQARQYVHVKGSPGYLYLLDIAMHIQVNLGGFLQPSQFCTEFYSKSKRQKTAHKDNARTSRN